MNRGFMPVRKIPPNTRSVTGLVPLGDDVEPAAYESSLEADLYSVLAWEDSVQFEPQPVRIAYRPPGHGRLRRYYPDVLIRYSPGHALWPRRPLLAEVKYRQEVIERWDELEPKFRAAYRYARDRDWGFTILTEREIRTPKLRNIRRLRTIQADPPTEGSQRKVLAALEPKGQSSPRQLLDSLACDRADRAELLHVIWYLVASKAIRAALEQDITIDSPIWVPKQL